MCSAGIPCDSGLSRSSSRIRTAGSLTGLSGSTCRGQYTPPAMFASSAPQLPVRDTLPRGLMSGDRSSSIGRAVSKSGSGSTQLNKFNYRVEQPRLSLEPMLRDNPGLTRSLALTARYPGSAVVERSFTGQLAQAAERPSTSKPAASVLPRGTSGLGVRDGMGVQYGRDNYRRDSIDISVGRVQLTHWTPPRSTAESGDIKPAQPGIAREATIPRPAREATETASPYRLGRIDPTGSRISPSTHGPGGPGGLSAILMGRDASRGEALA